MECYRADAGVLECLEGEPFVLVADVDVRAARVGADEDGEPSEEDLEYLPDLIEILIERLGCVGKNGRNCFNRAIAFSGSRGLSSTGMWIVSSALIVHRSYPFEFKGFGSELVMHTVPFVSEDVDSLATCEVSDKIVRVPCGCFIAFLARWSLDRASHQMLPVQLCLRFIRHLAGFFLATKDAVPIRFRVCGFVGLS